MPVTEIGTGRCPGCLEEGRLVDGACVKCRTRFGRSCGRVMERVRSDPRFALLCYRALRDEEERRKFVEMFGDPRPAG